MAYPTLFFGVELEFSVAYLYPNEPPIDPTELRPHNVCPSEELIKAIIRSNRRGTWSRSDFEDRSLLTNGFRRLVMQYAAFQSIRKRFATASLPVEARLESEAYQNDIGLLENWNFKDDASINQPTDTRYNWARVEAVSPAYEFNPENIKAVETACNTITTNFLTHNGDSTGLHVHISFGLDRKWSFNSIRSAVMFFWTFHPQFTSMHAPSRHDYIYGKSIRTSSKMETDHFREIGRSLTPLEGLLILDACKDIEELADAVAGDAGGKDRSMAYNILPLYASWDMDLAYAGGAYKTTFEFRQHEGTLDNDRVTQWIKLLCGIITFLENVQPRSLMDMLQTVAKQELWVKTGTKEKDEEMEKTFGPVLAEDGFTLIDLLEHIGLQESANFYRTRLH